ncbi:aromatic ring-hydroxylating dioxygenase subunit alpha [Phormidesmis priestleyi ULC007]|uniref:Aromatic ring-hydroxylating dioxygenase subunit alpha n=1 Tax=Phormidesmis priestleyi ULC007 TaxID=1920490 RepID=A0A2T1DGF5_9CYAN|nr:aromatic ring-hydroxylating dioxygenase subunit alpha [Phormidesmis priestleyi]PSB19555.1 aromatic ring-hydroxylating dioxygenase subunit alpha [Phormidesmis priestleyi ULC007]PZO53162.1 MAG: aromatic ring-hydroxylating dioxygenase subunit alpha [Phormidesmis priestleyi]
MELATTLKSQTPRSQVREVGINGNYWYAIAWATDLKPTKILTATVWQQSIALYRDRQNQIQAVENVCPHKGVSLDKGKVEGDAISCPYHGWEFNGQGECLNIPYFPPDQKLPCVQIRSFPVQEKYGLIWVFPGDQTLAEAQPLIEIPEYNDPNWLLLPVGATFKAHFSICNENTMDVFHGHLHKNLQGWFDPVLLKLRETENSVNAEYQLSYTGIVSQLLGLSQSADRVTTKVISVDYRYPHYINHLPGISSLYLMRLPIAPQESRSFSLLFLKLGLPQWLLTILRPILQLLIINLLFLRFLRQDIEMIESEQENYLKNPQRRYVEVNPAIVAAQRLMVQQYEQFTRPHPLENPLESSVSQEASA